MVGHLLVIHGALRAIEVVVTESDSGDVGRRNRRRRTQAGSGGGESDGFRLSG